MRFVRYAVQVSGAAFKGGSAVWRPQTTAAKETNTQAIFSNTLWESTDIVRLPKVSLLECGCAAWVGNMSSAWSFRWKLRSSLVTEGFRISPEFILSKIAASTGDFTDMPTRKEAGQFLSFHSSEATKTDDQMLSIVCSSPELF